MLTSTSLVAHNFQMVSQGIIRLSRLQALCRPGDHDQAEVHDSPQDVQHFPDWLQVQSFYDEKQPKSPEAGAASKEDKGKSPISSTSSQYAQIACPSCYQRHSSSVNYCSSPSLTPSSMMRSDTDMPQIPDIRITSPGASTSSASPSAPPLSLPTASGPSNGHGVGAFNGYAPGYSLASGNQESTAWYYTWVWVYQWPWAYAWPVPSTVLSVPAPYFPFAQANTPSGTCRTSSDEQVQYTPASPSAGSMPSIQAPSYSLPIRPHPRYAAELATTPLSNQQPYKSPEPPNMYHHVFAVFESWEFTAVEVARCSLGRTNDVVPIGGFPLCRCRIETVCYLPASDDGTEGIPPLPQSVPGAPILSQRHSGNHAVHVTDSAADTYRYCPVQLYLRSMEGKGDAKRFSYRNDKMHLNQMIELQLDVESLARRVAVALALMHWAACIDAGGVQFYLVSSWKSGQREQLLPTGSEPGQSLDSLARGHTSLRVGRFEEAQTMKMDEDGVELAVEAAKRSLYIPRPNQKLPIQRRTWDAFVSSYIAASDIILRSRGGRLRLPRFFIHKVLQEEPSWQRP
ncbi:hypothetical protein GGI35DRAFT_47285 [Trichoderma velutinum]